MKNYEKYTDEIKNYRHNNFCNDFVIPHIFKAGEHCCNMNCDACRLRQMIWLLEDYEEPEVDWSKVEVDTPILVRDDEIDNWTKRHFAKYEHSKVFAWAGGRTSWNETDVLAWKYAKLAEGGDE